MPEWGFTVKCSVWMVFLETSVNCSQTSANNGAFFSLLLTLATVEMVSSEHWFGFGGVRGIMGVCGCISQEFVHVCLLRSRRFRVAYVGSPAGTPSGTKSWTTCSTGGTYPLPPFPWALCGSEGGSISRPAIALGDPLVKSSPGRDRAQLHVCFRPRRGEVQAPMQWYLQEGLSARAGPRSLPTVNLA